MPLLTWVVFVLQLTVCAGELHDARPHMRPRSFRSAPSSAKIHSKPVAAADFERLALADQMQVVADTLPDGVTKDLLHAFKVTGQCQNFKRFGEDHDGGYLTCLDGLSPENIKAAYSVGVNHADKWSLDMYSKLKIDIHQFDCTVDQAAQKCPTCDWFQVCLQAKSGAGAVPGKKNWALQEALEKTNQGSAPERSLVMKMDIEGSEWPLLAETGGTGDALGKFQQLILEFHWLDREDEHATFLKALQNVLGAGFRVAHVHGNNWSSMYKVGGYSLPNVVEVTFVSSGQPLAHSQDPVRHPLDAANNPNPASSDLPDTHLP